jgi:hypothetical protein
MHVQLYQETVGKVRFCKLGLQQIKNFLLNHFYLWYCNEKREPCATPSCLFLFSLQS